MHLPDHEIIYYKNKVSHDEIKNAMKDFPKEKRLIFIISILVGAFIPSIFSQVTGIAKGIFYVLTIIATYLLIVPISLRIPKEWAIGSMGIYLPFLFKRKIEWNEIKEVKDAPHGFIVFHNRIWKTYLITKEKEKVSNIFKSFIVK